MAELVAGLLIFISANSDLNHLIPNAPDFNIGFISQQEMIQRYFGDSPPERTDPWEMYVEKTKTIYLLTGWDEKNLVDQYRLLHGLVHHVQYYPGYKERYQCPSQMEAEAIRIVDKWRIAHGLEPEAPKEDIQAQAILVLWEKCMGGIHQR